jgi:hypothetical protein
MSDRQTRENLRAITIEQRLPGHSKQSCGSEDVGQERVMMLFITRITLDEQGHLQKRTRLPGFSRSVEDARQKLKNEVSVYPKHGFDVEHACWWAIDASGTTYRFVIGEP